MVEPSKPTYIYRSATADLVSVPGTSDAVFFGLVTGDDGLMRILDTPLTKCGNIAQSFLYQGDSQRALNIPVNFCADLPLCWHYIQLLVGHVQPLSCASPMLILYPVVQSEYMACIVYAAECCLWKKTRFYQSSTRLLQDALPAGLNGIVQKKSDAQQLHSVQHNDILQSCSCGQAL